MIDKKINGGSWKGSCEGEVDDELEDVDDQLRPIRKPDYHATKGQDKETVMPPGMDALGHDFLDSTLRDMTGFSLRTSHMLTHDPDRFPKGVEPCWTSLEVGTRQIRKYQSKCKKKQDEHPKRTIQMLGIRAPETMRR